MPNIVRISHFDVNVGRILGEGGFGKVYRAKDVSEETPVECAAKQMQLNNDTRPAMEREVQFMKTVGDHPSIIGFKECVSFGSDAELPIAKNTTWIFMEMATGGELFDRLIDSGNLTEREPLPASPSLPRPLASLGLSHVHTPRRCRASLLQGHDGGAVALPLAGHRA